MLLNEVIKPIAAEMNEIINQNGTKNPTSILNGKSGCRLFPVELEEKAGLGYEFVRCNLSLKSLTFEKTS